MKITLPRKVLMIINNLQLHGYEAFAVGGCVRDSILARRPEDWDITTSARPEEIKKLFRRTVDTGIEHGTVTVLIGKDSFEVTTYRVDGAYEDSRHPTEVRFTSRLEDDLQRRDFTINAMAYNDEVRLVDVFGGMRDLNHHLIFRRCPAYSEGSPLFCSAEFSHRAVYCRSGKGTGSHTCENQCGAYSGRIGKASCFSSSGTYP